jgi:hypothetical protein
LLARILGNLHILPVPTTAPSMENSTPKDEEKVPYGRCMYNNCTE